MDNIKSPNHYKLNGLKIESIDVIKAVLGRDGFSAFCHGNVLKYLIRARKKNGPRGKGWRNPHESYPGAQEKRRHSTSPNRESCILSGRARKTELKTLKRQRSILSG